MDTERKELLALEADLKETLVEESDKLERSFLTGLKNAAIIGGSLAVGYTLVKLLSSEKTKKLTKNSTGGGVLGAVLSLAAKTAVKHYNDEQTKGKENDL